MKVLVIDDNEINRKSARDTLEGHDLTIADSMSAGGLAMFHAKKNLPFEAVLTDMNMPREEEGELAAYGFIIALMAVQYGAKYIAMVTRKGGHDDKKDAMAEALSSLGPWHYTNKQRLNINGARVMFVYAPTTSEATGEGSCPSCSGSGTCKYCDGTGIFVDEDRRQDNCHVCHNSQGGCHRCKGEGKVKIYGKDWGRVLSDLIAP